MGNYHPSEQPKKFRAAPRFWLWVLAAALVFPLALRAQDTGYISGTVTDKTGAAVVGAEVTLTNAAGTLTRNTTTNTDGAYVLAALPGGTYKLVITAKGFQKFTAQNVVLNVAEKSRIDVQLTVGAINEVVEVTGESVAQVETSSSDLSGTVTGKQIDQLMLNGRNYTQLVTLVPGVVNQGPDEGQVGVTNIFYSINGGRLEYNNWEVDGGDNMDNGSNQTLTVFPNIEAIAEFKVLTSNYGAQYGRNGSGTIEVETKSGTNSFHGSAFEYLRNDVFNARSWEEGADPTQHKAPYKKHDFGYTVGGPFYIPNHFNSDKKRTFFFWSEEWRREKNPDTLLSNVPSDAERGLVNGSQTGFGDFSDLCPGTDCPNVPNPTAVPISPVGQALLALIPQANTTNNGFPAVLNTVSPPTKWREELIRVDHNLTDNYRLTFRYIHDSWQTEWPNPLWGQFAGSESFHTIRTKFVGPGTSFVARLTANISPTLLNEFVASYSGDHIFLSTVGPAALPSGFAMGSLFNNGFGGKLPAITLASNLAYGGGFNQDTGYFPWNNANPTYTYRDNVTKIVRNHTMQFGFYSAFAQKNEQNSPDLQGILTFDSSSPVSTGNAFADLLLGNVAQYEQWNLQTKYYNRYRIVEPYFQDDWRATKRLTLNLGFRLSLFGTYRDRYRRAFNFEPSSFNAANAPTIDVDGSATGSAGAFIPGSGNPFNGIIQCGGAGGTFPVAGFPSASAGGSSSAGCLKGHLFNPAPRLGFAFDPKGDGKMAIRGGYGIFFEHTNGNEGNTESLEGSPPFVLTASQFDITGYGNIGGSGSFTPFFPLSVNSIPNKAIWPYVQQWHLDVQKDLPSHIVGTISYVGSKGTHLTLERNLNQLHAVAPKQNPYSAGQTILQSDCNTITTDASGNPNGATLSNGTVLTANSPGLTNLFVACGNSPDPLRPLLGLSDITRLEDTANSIYHAFQASARRTVGDLTLSVAYTYSHSIDDSSDRFDGAFVDSYNVARNRGSSSFDQRHNLAISYVYGLPFYKGEGLAHILLGGWQVSGITVASTGNPFSVTNGSDFGDSAGVANGVGTGSRPDLVGNPHAGLTQTNFPDTRGPLFYNPAAFAVPTGLTFGNVGRNTLYLPGRLNFDFGLFKRFTLGENKEIDFRWENFNLFNHTQFNSINSSMDTTDPGSNLDSSGFMHLNGAHRPRTMQFGLRFQF